MRHLWIIIFTALALNISAQNKHIRIPIAGGGGTANTDTQKLYIVSNVLYIGGSDGGNSVTLPSGGGGGSQTIDTFTIVSNILRASLSGDGEAFKSVNLAPYLDNTDNQALSLASNVLSLTNGGSVNLSAYLDNTDNQSMSTTGNTMTLSGGGGSYTVTAGTNMTITNIGSSSNPNFLFTSAGGGGGSTPTDLAWVNWSTNQWVITSSTGNDVLFNFNTGGFSTSLAGNTLSISANDVSSTNEIDNLTWSSITSTSAVLNSSGGTDVTLNVSGGLSISGSSTSLTITQAGGGSVTGSGTTNFLPIWTSSTSLGSSVIQQSSGNIGINTAPVAGVLTQWPSGDIRIGTLSFTGNRILFGDGALAWIGEEAANDDRLVLRGRTMAFNFVDNGGLGSNGQVVKNVGGIASWGTDNDAQTLSFNSGTGALTISNGNTVTITAGGGSSTDLGFTGSGPVTLTSSSGADVTLTAGSGISYSASTTNLTISAADVSATNELQTISLASNIITLSNGGGTVNLSSYLDNTDNQMLGASFGQITLTNGGTINLSATGLASISASGNVITVGATYSDPDASATNELQNLSLTGQSLGISLGGTGVTLPVINVSSGSGISVSASSGNYTVTNTGDLSTSNEIQSLSLSGQSLGISLGGSGVTLPVINVVAGSGISVSASSGAYTVTNTGDLNSSNELQTLSYSASANTLNISSGNTVNMFGSTQVITMGSSDVFVDINATFIQVNTGGSGNLRLPSTVVNGKIFYIIARGVDDQTVLGMCDGTTNFTAGRLIVVVGFNGCWYTGA